MADEAGEYLPLQGGEWKCLGRFLMRVMLLRGDADGVGRREEGSEG